MYYIYKRAENKLRFGFSLVELLVVIATVALLLSILMPSLGKARSMAMRVKCAHNLKQIDLAVSFYLDGNGDTYPCAEDPVSKIVSTDPNDYYWLWMGRGWRAFVEPYLDTNINKDNPSVLFCPQDRKAKEHYESTSYAYSMAFYHSPQQIDNMGSPSDTYDKNKVQPSIPQQCSNVARPSGKILIGEWDSNHYRIDDDKGWWGWQGRRNYLFADGRVHCLQAGRIREANDGLPDANLTVGGIKGRDWPRVQER